MIFTNKGSQAVLASRETPRANQIIVLVSLIVIEKPDDESIDNQHGKQGQDTGENRAGQRDENDGDNVLSPKARA